MGFGTISGTTTHADRSSQGGRSGLPRRVCGLHPGGQLADRPCRHRLRARGAVPDPGRARLERAQRRADDRACPRLARPRSAPARPCLGFGGDSRRCGAFSGCRTRIPGGCVGGRLPRLRACRLRRVHAAAAPRLGACCLFQQHRRVDRRFCPVPAAGLRQPHLPAGPDRRQGVDGRPRAARGVVAARA